MSNIKFYRGDSSRYDSSTMRNGIYFACDTNTVISDGIEYGNYPKEFSIPTSGTEVEYKVFCQNYSPNSQRFSYETEIDFAKGDFIQVEIDLSKSTKPNGINVISIGENIAKWKNNILWLYRKDGGELSLRYTNPNGETLSKDMVFDLYTIFVLKVSLNGVYVNGEKITDFSQSAISPLTSLSKIQIGSNRDDDSDALSDAKYKKISLYKRTDVSSMGLTYKPNANVTRYLEFPVSNETTNGLMSYQDKIKLDMKFGSGINEVTTLANVPISKKYVYATINKDETLSLDLNSYKDVFPSFPIGNEIKIIVKNNSSGSITVTLPHTEYICFAKTLKLDFEEYTMITVYIKSETVFFFDGIINDIDLGYID